MLNEEVDFDELRKIKKRKFFEKLSQMNKRGKREVIKPFFVKIKIYYYFNV